MRLFATPKTILEEIEQLNANEKNRREDRATVSEFFNGKAPLTDEEAREIGLTINVNNLFGYTDLADIKSQALSLFTKPTDIFRVEVDAMPMHRLFERGSWEGESSNAFNLLVKQSGMLKPAYESCSGDAALHGESLFTFPNKTIWCPGQTPLSRLLIPDDAPTDLKRQTHWGVEADLSLSELHKYASGDYPFWKTAALKKILYNIYKDVEGASADAISYDNAEELEYKRQQNSAKDGGRRRPSVKVVYFYQVRCDKPGNPVDLTIVLHRDESIMECNEDADKVLFEAECYYDSVEEIISPSFMDCTLGGESKWHRVLGPGTLNYALAHATEILICRAMQGTIEGMMNLWQTKDGQSREDVQEILMRHNGVVPENIGLIQQRFTPDMAGSLQMIQYFRQQGKANVQRTGGGNDSDMLEVQAIAAQNQQQEISSARTANWYDHLDRLATAMWARLVNPYIQSWEPGYSDCMKFRSRLRRLEIPLYYLQPWNVRVTAVRVLGDGSTQKEKAAALWLTQNRAMFPPQAQQRITRMATAAMTGSYQIAKELVPFEKEEDTSQTQIADNESNTCIVQGRVPPVNDTDVDDVHFPVHLQAMIQMVQTAGEEQQASFTPTEFKGFRALGAHCVAHINKIRTMVAPGQKDPNKAKSAQWMQALNEVVSVGEKMANNMRQKQEDSNAKPDPVEVAKLRIASQQLDLSYQKLGFSREKWERQQRTKESQQSFQQMLALEKNRREEQTTQSKIGTNDVQTALAVREHARGENEPAE